MRRFYRVALMLGASVFLIGCPAGESPETVGAGRLELLWSLDEGSPPGEPWFARIWHVAVANDRIYVADWQRKTVIALDETGGFIRTIGREGDGPGELADAAHVTVADGGDVYVLGGAGGTLERFTPDGEVIGRINHRGREAGTDQFSGMERPLALDDSTFVYEAFTLSRISAEEALSVPLLVVVRGDQQRPLGQRRIPDGADGVRLSLLESPDQNLVWNFTGGDKCRGSRSGEILFVRRSDPYTVFRLVEGEPEESFSYLDAGRSDWVSFFETPGEEYYSALRAGDRRFVGENIVLQQQRPPKNFHSFAFVHTLRGLARVGDELFVYVEILKEGFAENRTEEMIEKKLFVIDLETGRLEAVIPVSIDGPASLVGALGNGALVFTFLRSYPAIHAYRIVRTG